MDLYKFVTLVGSVHFMDWGLDPWWGPSTDGSNLSVVITQQSLNVFSIKLKAVEKSTCPLGLKKVLKKSLYQGLFKQKAKK